MRAMVSAEGLTAPVLLLAMPQVLDPFFHKAVVLLVHHEEAGSFGFIVNRPTGIKVQEILGGMQIPWQGAAGDLAYFGGPVQPQLGTVLFAPRESELGMSSEVAPGLGITQHVGDLEQLAGEPPEHFRLFLGYAGWGEGQLVQEILRNDWLTAPVQPELVFATDPEGVWEGSLRSVGVDPGTLPSWTAEDPGEEAN